MVWPDKVRLTLQEYVETNLHKDSTIVKDTIKTRISGGQEDVLPPRYHVRIIYDVINNEEIHHMDSIYKVDFCRLAKTPENAKLVKLFEMEYKPPKKFIILVEIMKSHVLIYQNTLEHTNQMGLDFLVDRVGFLYFM